MLIFIYFPSPGGLASKNFIRASVDLQHKEGDEIRNLSILY